MRARYIRGTPAERFWPKVRKTDGCWYWEGGQVNGYGQFRVAPCPAPNERAHRVAYELVYGPITGDLFALHRCDTPLCVKVTGDPAEDHIFLGTAMDNVQDMIAKGRARFEQGGRSATVTPEMCREVRDLLRSHSTRQVADLYGVHHTTIIRAARRATAL